MLTPIFYIGLAIVGGFVGGLFANKLKLPRVTGYILVGILFSPYVTGIVPLKLIQGTDPLTNFALALITFTVGGSLSMVRLKRFGRTILTTTIFEAETAFLLVIAAFAILLPVFLKNGGHHSYLLYFLPAALLFGAMASPTDPAATLAVVHEYRARGPLTTSLLAVAASDDALGIVNYSFAVSVAAVLTKGAHLSPLNLILTPLKDIFGSIFLGIIAGIIIWKAMDYIFREGAVLSVTTGILLLVYGASSKLNFDPLLTTMTAGAVVVNFSRHAHRLFEILEKYYEELIFTLFFVISGAHIQPVVLLKAFPLVIIFVLFRFAGKIGGAYFGAKLSKAPPQVYKNIGFGLVPQGGIVVGLAFLISKLPEFQSFGNVLLNVVIGTTTLHEILGPVFSKIAISRAGELKGGEHEED